MYIYIINYIHIIYNHIYMCVYLSLYIYRYMYIYIYISLSLYIYIYIYIHIYTCVYAPCRAFAASTLPGLGRRLPAAVMRRAKGTAAPVPLVGGLDHSNTNNNNDHCSSSSSNNTSNSNDNDNDSNYDNILDWRLRPGRCSASSLSPHRGSSPKGMLSELRGSLRDHD